jgi:hypothetical protein
VNLFFIYKKKLFFDELDTCFFFFFLYLPCGFQIRIWNIVNELVCRDVELGSYFCFKLMSLYLSLNMIQLFKLI